MSSGSGEEEVRPGALSRSVFQGILWDMPAFSFAPNKSFPWIMGSRRVQGLGHLRKRLQSMGLSLGSVHVLIEPVHKEPGDVSAVLIRHHLVAIAA